MNQADFDNLPDMFAERTNGGHKGTGVLQFGYKNGFNKAIELLGARVEHAPCCKRLTPYIPSKKEVEQIKVSAPTNECTCGLETIMKGYPLHG